MKGPETQVSHTSGLSLLGGQAERGSESGAGRWQLRRGGEIFLGDWKAGPWHTPSWRELRPEAGGGGAAWGPRVLRAGAPGAGQRTQGTPQAHTPPGDQPSPLWSPGLTWGGVVGSVPAELGG